MGNKGSRITKTLRKNNKAGGLAISNLKISEIIGGSQGKNKNRSMD